MIHVVTMVFGKIKSWVKWNIGPLRTFLFSGFFIWCVTDSNLSVRAQNEVPQSRAESTKDQEQKNNQGTVLSKKERAKRKCELFLYDGLGLPYECSSAVCNRCALSKIDECVGHRIMKTKQCPEPVRAIDIYKEYDGNELRADDKYKGKRVFLLGVSMGVEKDAQENIIVKLNGTPWNFQEDYGIFHGNQRRFRWVLLYPVFSRSSSRSSSGTLDAMEDEIVERKMSQTATQVPPIYRADTLLNSVMIDKVGRRTKILATCVGYGLNGDRNPVFKDCFIYVLKNEH